MEETQRDLTIKEAELKHLTLQLALLTNQNTDTITQLHDQAASLKVGLLQVSVMLVLVSPLLCQQ